MGGGGSSNLRTASSKKYAIVFGIFALVIVTTAASFAFFTYSRTGETTTTITSGDIEFSFIEGTSANLANAFPVADSIGATDTTGEYTFDVRMSSSSTNYKMNYNVMLVDNNNDENVNYFTNEQIKFSLIKDNVYVANTTESSGLKLSTIPGFSETSSNGYGYVLQEQEITSGKTDNYKLRIWISDDVNYSDEIDENGTMTGKYNSYKYSLKVKVTSGLGNTTLVDNLETAGPAIIADLSDPNGLDSYAVTKSSTAPESESTDWIDITDTTAKSKTMRLASNLITRKTIRYEVSESGTYYLHVRNKKNEVSTKEVVVSIDKYIITFDGNGGTSTSSSKEVIDKTTYGELPSATRTGYIFDGWYTSSTDGEKITESTSLDLTDNQTLYARWISKTFADKAAVLTEFTGTTAETIMCEESNDNNYYDCDEMTLIETAAEERDGTIFLLKDIEYNDKIRFNTSNTKIMDMNGFNIVANKQLNIINRSIVTIIDQTGKSKLTSNSDHTIVVAEDSKLYLNDIEVSYTGTTSASLWIASSCASCNVNINNANIISNYVAIAHHESSSNSSITINNSNINSNTNAINNVGNNNSITLNNVNVTNSNGNAINNKGTLIVNDSKIDSKGSYAINNNSNLKVNNSYVSSKNSLAIANVDNGTTTINGEYPTFDSEGNYISGTYIYSNYSDGATIQINTGILKVNGGYIYHDSAENGTWRQCAIRQNGGTSYLNDGTIESLGSREVINDASTIYVNGNNTIINVNGANIKGALNLNSVDDISAKAYICKGQIKQLINGTNETAGTFFLKSSGITWEKVPSFGQYVIQDDTITCSE